MQRLQILISVLCALLGAANYPSNQESNPASACALAVAVSPDGSLIAAGYDGGDVALLDATDGERVYLFAQGLGFAPWALAFSPDGRRLAGIGHDGRLRLWTLPGNLEENATSTELLNAVPAWEWDSWPFGITMTWSPTGRRLVVADHDGRVSLWTSSGDVVKRWNQNDPATDETVIWTRDGSLLLIAEGPLVQLRDGVWGELRSEGALVGKIRCPQRVVAMAIHPREDLLVTGHADCRLMVWSLRTGDLVTEGYFRDPVMQEKSDEIASIAYSPAGDRLGISIREGCFVFVLDPKRLTSVWSSEWLGAHFGEAVRILWSPNGARLWFAFECGSGDLYWVAPKDNAEPKSRENTNVPTFCGEVGAIITGGTVHAVTAEGVLKW